MRYLMVPLLFLLGCAWLVYAVPAEDVGAGTPSKRYSLALNGQIVELDLGEEVKIDFEGKEWVLRLTKNPFYSHRAQLAEFRVPGRFSVNSVDLGDGVVQHAVLSALGNVILVQEYSRLNPRLMTELMLEELTKESVHYGYEMARDQFNRVDANAIEFRGVRATLTYGDSRQEVVIVTYGDRDRGVLVAMVLQSPNSDDSQDIRSIFDSIVWNPVDGRDTP